MPAPTAITIPGLRRLVGTPACPAIAHVGAGPGAGPDMPRDPQGLSIPGAFDHPAGDLPGLAARLRGRRSVIVCRTGTAHSPHVAGWLRLQGIEAGYLAGGTRGWRAAQAPVIRRAAVPFDARGQSFWITSDDPAPAPLACAWLIRRFVDPQARFLVTAPGEVRATAALCGATPFGIAGVTFGGPPGACPFRTMLTLLHLSCPALDRLAAAVGAAAGDRAGAHPLAPGLVAACAGLARRCATGDARLAAGLSLLDGLYLWARDGHETGQPWPDARA